MTIDPIGLVVLLCAVGVLGVILGYMAGKADGRAEIKESA
jgi:hypothetical protein